MKLGWLKGTMGSSTGGAHCAREGCTNTPGPGATHLWTRVGL